MSVKAKSGRTISKAKADRLAAKAEAGFDLSGWKPRRGRPALQAGATEHAPRISVRLPAPLHRRVALRASKEGRAVSDVVRLLLTDYAADDGSVMRAARTGSSGPVTKSTLPVKGAANASKAAKSPSERDRPTPRK
ncbi:MAG TPA: hypothetical protein VH813_01200 [Candidatus Limnocylindrales bacterium]|jgi:hypothetical protein